MLILLVLDALLSLLACAIQVTTNTGNNRAGPYQPCTAVCFWCTLSSMQGTMSLLGCFESYVQCTITAPHGSWA